MKSAAIILFWLLSPYVLSCQNFKTQSISLFKDGTVFFLKKGYVDAANNKAILSGLPFQSIYDQVEGPVYSSRAGHDANLVLFGTIGFSAPGNSILSVTSFEQKEKTEKPAAGLYELFQLNTNKRLRIYQKGSKEPFTAIISSVVNNIGAQASFFLLLEMENEKGWKGISSKEIDAFEFLNKPVLMSTGEKSSKVLQLDFEKSNPHQEVELMYLQKGISWTPNYYLELLGNNKAKLSLKAGLMNDIENLDGVDVNFILGIPAFRYSFVKDPLASEQKVIGFLANLQNPPAERSAMMANVITSQRAMSYRSEEYSTNYSPDLEGLSEEDLFFYKKENILLPKGGRMQLPLLETDIYYEDIYTLELAPNFKDQRFITESDAKDHQVWHALKFTNASNFPLTTGTVFFIKNEKGLKSPVSQGRLDFTLAGAPAMVKMTVAPDIAVINKEAELERVEDARKYKDLVTVEASIQLSNYKKNKIKLEINRQITGQLLESSLDWEIQSTAGNLSGINKKYLARWKFSLKAGASKTITYRYKVYVD